ncbi:hypothetical protein Peur_028233 [Populus x canadensis]
MITDDILSTLADTFSCSPCFNLKSVCQSMISQTVVTSKFLSPIQHQTRKPNPKKLMYNEIYK